MEKQQFDEYLGGNQRLPREVHNLKLATARATEIAELTRCLENPQQTKLIFQKLPVQMRRRVMSHNAKRMPRRLREGHMKQMLKAGLPSKTKTPSRKFRRRPRNLLLEYNRRQRIKFWMELHLWHAKRFKMSDKYGFKIPKYSYNRCFKANYRAIKDHCLIQDISYYTCVELRGPKNFLTQTLQGHCNPSRLTFGARCWSNGEREGTLMFFKRDKYPKCPLGNVHFLWENKEETSKMIWIWIHPANYNDIIKEIISSFAFVIQDEGNSKLQEIELNLRKEDWNDVNTMPPMMRLFRDVKTPVYTGENECRMTILRNQLNRFRLRGPLSLDVLTEALRIPQLKLDTKKLSGKEDWEMDLDPDESKNESPKSWVNEFYSEEKNAEAFRVQNKTMLAMRNQKPGHLPPNMVMGLTVLDPRFFLPTKRMKACSDAARERMLPKPPTLANNSPLWNRDLRKLASEGFVPPHEIDKLRSECLVTGVDNDEHFSEDVMRKVPIMLIQKPGTSGSSKSNDKTDTFSSGIDVVLPLNWAMPFWMAFILRNARVAGFRESLMIPFETMNFDSPDYYHPDTPAYEREARNTKSRLTERYFRKPPKKRVNFIKYCVPGPFSCQWNLLMREWTNAPDFCVLRDRAKLLLLQENLNAPKQSLDVLMNNFDSKNYLVPVKISLEKRGSPQNFAAICIPLEADVDRFESEKNWSGPMQKIGVDPFEKERKKLRIQHRNLLKRLKRKRIRMCKVVEKMHSDLATVKQLQKSIRAKNLEDSKRRVKEHASLMRRLYLPEPEKVRNASDRETIGFITQGAFSYSEAKGVGLGYVVLQSIFDLVKRKQHQVLIRNTQSKFFRFSRIEVLC